MEERHLSKLGEETKTTEDDIPGTELVQNVEDWICTELRRCLLCRGTKTAG